MWSKYQRQDRANWQVGDGTCMPIDSMQVDRHPVSSKKQNLRLAKSPRLAKSKTRPGPISKLPKKFNSIQPPALYALSPRHPTQTVECEDLYISVIVITTRAIIRSFSGSPPIHGGEHELAVESAHCLQHALPSLCN